MKKKKNKCIGQSLDDYLKEEGIYEEVRARAIKKTIALKKKLHSLTAFCPSLKKKINE